MFVIHAAGWWCSVRLGCAVESSSASQPSLLYDVWNWSRQHKWAARNLECHRGDLGAIRPNISRDVCPNFNVGSSGFYCVVDIWGWWHWLANFFTYITRKTAFFLTFINKRQKVDDINTFPRNISDHWLSSDNNLTSGGLQLGFRGSWC